MRRQLFRLLLGLLVLVIGAAGCTLVRQGPSRGTAAEPTSPPTIRPAMQSSRPNLLLITTDDQNLGDLRWMPRTRRLLGVQGMTFSQALSSHPLCCPARAEILTGQYAQNNGVRHNHGPHGGFPRLDATQTIGRWMHEAGYRTAFLGKFLNEFNSHSPRPLGWDAWFAMVAGVYDYVGTRFSTGTRTSTRTGYSVDVVSDRTVAEIDRWADGPAPFFIWASHVAPHADDLGEGEWGPPVTAKGQRRTVRATAPSLRKPSFGVPAGIEPDCVCQTGSWSRDYIQRYFQKRVASLRSVDRAVAVAVRALHRSGVLDETYVVFTSDNGYLLGEHGFIGKNLLYEENMRIPLLVRGPGIESGSRSGQAVALVDLTSTLLRAARVPSPLVLDGTSFLRTLHGRPRAWRDTQLIQTGTRREDGSFALDPFSGWGYRGVRTARYTFGMDSLVGRPVLYDRKRDPFQMHDVADLPRYTPVVRELTRRTLILAGCSGDGCDRRFGPVR